MDYEAGSRQETRWVGDRAKRDPKTCDRAGPALVEPADGGLVATCFLCDTAGPERETVEEARRALLDPAGDRRGE